MSLSIGLIAVVALVYMAILFAIAFYGDRRRTPLSPRLRAWVYSLSLAVYCTSWTFFGAVGQATDQLWSFLPIYLGPVLLMLFAPWVLQKMIMISKQENITSIADFIAARYGKSQALAVVVALICMVGVLPYIALQLKGIVLGVNLLIGSGADSTGTRAQDTALIVSLVLALFTIVFGTRSLDVTEHHAAWSWPSPSSRWSSSPPSSPWASSSPSASTTASPISSPRPAPRRSWPTTGKRPCTGRRCCCRPAWR